MGSSALVIATGYGHTCALLRGRSVGCWGYNNLWQLGIGSRSDFGDWAGEMGNSLQMVQLGFWCHFRWSFPHLRAAEQHECGLLGG